MNRYLFLLTYMNFRNLPSSSTVALFRKIAVELIERGDIVYWYIPRQATHYEIVAEDVKKIGVHVIYEDVSVGDQYLDPGYVPRDLIDKFNRITGEYFIDAIITTDAVIVLYLLKTLQHPTSRRSLNGKSILGTGGEIAVGLWEVFPKIPTKNSTRVVSGKAELMSQYAGYVCSDFVAFGGELDKSDMLTCAGDYISYSQVRDLRDRIEAQGWGIDIEYLDTFYDESKQRKTTYENSDPIRVGNVGRLSPHNTFYGINAAVKEFQMGKNVELHLFSQGTPSVTLEQREPEIFDIAHIHENFGRKRFLNYLKDVHIGVTTSNRHNFPTAILETMYLGVPFILPRAVWTKAYLPDDYPYYFELTGQKKDKAKQVHAIMRKMIAEYPETVAIMEKVHNYLKENVNAKNIMANSIAKIEAAIQEKRDKFTGRLGAMRIMFSEFGQKEFTVNDFLKYVKDNSQSGKELGVDRALGFTVGRADVILYLLNHPETFEDLGTTSPMKFRIRD